MARKQARRRKQKKAGRLRMPSIPIARRLLDRPIESIAVNGPFQRVTPLQIEEAISGDLESGFFGADVGLMQEKIQGLAWIDRATVARRWPDRIAIGVTEQVPAAIWGESGLLNVRGELFVTEARHIPAELPRLSGPNDRSDEVARRYLAITLTNGVEIRLGRRDVDERTSLFLDVVANIITGRAADIDYVDMRYSNGFTIGWNDGATTPTTEPEKDDEALLALRGTP
jgi:cell division protein FtsQ